MMKCRTIWNCNEQATDLLGSSSLPCSHIEPHMRYLTFLIILQLTQLQAQTTIGSFTVDDHLVSATHSGGCDTQHLIGLPDNTCMVNMVDNSSITGNFGSAWPDRPGVDLVFENCYTTGDCSIRLILTDGTMTGEHVIPFNGFDSLAYLNWTFTTVPSCGTQFLFGNSASKIATIDFATDFSMAPGDSVQGIRIEFLPGFNTDPAGVYIVSDPSTGIPEMESPRTVSLVTNMLSFQGLPPDTEIMIFDQTGRCAHTGRTNGEEFRSYIASWPTGVYLARLARNGVISTIRFVKVDP